MRVRGSDLARDAVLHGAVNAPPLSPMRRKTTVRGRTKEEFNSPARQFASRAKERANLMLEATAARSNRLAPWMSFTGRR
jgi:hypothetical protein